MQRGVSPGRGMTSGNVPRAEGFRPARGSRGLRVPEAAAVGAEEPGPLGSFQALYGLPKLAVLERPDVGHGLARTC